MRAGCLDTVAGTEDPSANMTLLGTGECWPIGRPQMCGLAAESKIHEEESGPFTTSLGGAEATEAPS